MTSSPSGNFVTPHQTKGWTQTQRKSMPGDKLFDTTGLYDTKNLMMRAIMGVFLLLTGFMLLLIFDGMVSEKTRDIGALRALGASPAGILKCFLLQAFFIGALGVLIAVLLRK